MAVDEGGEGVPHPRKRLGGRSARVRAAVLGATLAGITEEEGDALSIPRIAARAGVHETSIYRRWGSREALILDAVTSLIGEEIPVPDTGSLRGDLVAFLDRSIGFLSSPIGVRLVRATAPMPRTAPTDVRQAYWPRRFERIGEMFARAIARREIAPTADIALATEMLLAPLYFRLLITDRSLEDDLPERLTAFVLRGLMIAGTEE
jgi:AcrR family transcriptional regulator